MNAGDSASPFSSSTGSDASSGNSEQIPFLNKSASFNTSRNAARALFSSSAVETFVLRKTSSPLLWASFSVARACISLVTVANSRVLVSSFSVHSAEATSASFARLFNKSTSVLLASFSFERTVSSRVTEANSRLLISSCFVHSAEVPSASFARFFNESTSAFSFVRTRISRCTAANSRSAVSSFFSHSAKVPSASVARLFSKSISAFVIFRDPSAPSRIADNSTFDIQASALASSTFFRAWPSSECNSRHASSYVRRESSRAAAVACFASSLASCCASFARRVSSFAAASSDASAARAGSSVADAVWAIILAASAASARITSHSVSKRSFTLLRNADKVSFSPFVSLAAMALTRRSALTASVTFLALLCAELVCTAKARSKSTARRSVELISSSNCVRAVSDSEIFRCKSAARNSASRTDAV
mmetsp:Transcript_4924/g.18286  ORF Transcript_4924/g.18286 Transcript_4924/m.18286 type:complete len:423 (+) Transcript_4924:515-1783(+)